MNSALHEFLVTGFGAPAILEATWMGTSSEKTVRVACDVDRGFVVLPQKKGCQADSWTAKVLGVVAVVQYGSLGSRSPRAHG